MQVSSAKPGWLVVTMLLGLPGCFHGSSAATLSQAHRKLACYHAFPSEIPVDPSCQETWWSVALSIEERSTCANDADCTTVVLEPNPLGSDLAIAKRLVRPDRADMKKLHMNCGYLCVAHVGRPSEVRCRRGHCELEQYVIKGIARQSACEDEPE